jgi:hypothetical protein
MIYRKLTATGDMAFGRGTDAFHRNSVETVAQAIQTRLGLIRGEWFLDTTAGTFDFEVFGKGKESEFNTRLKDAIEATPGVQQLLAYTAYLEPSTRVITVNATVNTDYGTTALTATV